jgi:RNA polymerase sigma factor (sigma-70 family)
MTYQSADPSKVLEAAAELWREYGASLREAEKIAAITDGRKHPFGGYWGMALILMEILVADQMYFRERLLRLSLAVKRRKLEDRKPRTPREWWLLGEWVYAAQYSVICEAAQEVADRAALVALEAEDDPAKAIADAVLGFLKELPTIVYSSIEALPRPEQREAAWHSLAGWLQNELPYAPKSHLPGLAMLAFEENPHDAKGVASRAIDRARADERLRMRPRKEDPNYNTEYGPEEEIDRFERTEELRAARKRAVLSAREIEILELSLDDLNYREIGERLRITESTVKNTMKRIRDKLRAA